MTKTDEKWAERIRRWRESGKTAEEFTLGQPFKASTLVWRAADLRRRAAGSAGYGKGRGDATPIRMARVVARGRSNQDVSSSRIVVEVSSARITVSQGFDAKLFADVVRALAAGAR